MTVTHEIALRLGNALFHSLWQFTTLATLLAVALTLFRGAPARFRSLLASFTLLTAVVVFVATACTTRITSSHAEATATVSLSPYQSAVHPAAPPAPTAPFTEPFETAAAPAPRHTPDASLVFTALWLLGIASLTVRHALGVARIHHLRYSAYTLDHPVLAAALRGATTILRTTAPIPVLVTEKLTSPTLVGLLKPAVLIPASAVTGLPVNQLQLLLAHEFVHFKNLDPLLNHLTAAAETLLFYHPATWWIARVIRREREFACDDAIVAHFGQRHDYARALTSLHQLTVPSGLALASNGQPSTFAARIHRILGLSTPQPTAPATIAVLVTASAFTVTLTTAQTTPTPQTDRAPGTRGDIFDRNGTLVATSPSPSTRSYPLGANLAHVVGYTTAENETPKGRAGIERSTDRSLAAGDDVYLTIDARIQTAAENALRAVGRGAAVVLEPRTGDVLALVSLPSFDPTAFAVGISPDDFRVLQDNPAKPLFNRSLGAYPPASTFKLVAALTAAQANLTDSTFTCTGTHLIDGRSLLCWNRKGHGALDLGTALTTSCNGYFYQLAEQLGAGHIHAAATSFGYGSPTGIHLPAEAAGQLFDPAASDPTSLANHTIGHGEILATPLQLAVATATIANGGKHHTPRIVDRITDFETATTARTVPATHTPPAISPNHLTLIRNAMRDVVNSPQGTGSRAKSDRLTIAGKSGTAQTYRHHDGTRTMEYATWFTAFAPFENPELVVTVLVEHGVSGGATSAPLARQIIEDTLLDQLPAPAHLSPHPGHLNQVANHN